MKRRHLVTTLGAGGLATLAGCGGNSQENCNTKAVSTRKTVEWIMVTTWPKGYKVLGEGAEKLAQTIETMSDGRIKIKVFGANEYVPALQAFDTVASGAAHMGHGVSYYWKGKLPTAPFFGSIPFGLTAQEMNGWLLRGGGLELWQKMYKKFGLVPFPAGNTGVQMAGWFNQEINSLADIQGLKMRIPGLGGEVLKRAGGSPENIAGAEVFSALKSGRIAAAEWIGPYNDLNFGLHQAAKYYYYPGWHEPGAAIEVLVNESALRALPKDLQEIVKQACLAANNDILAEYTAQNWTALETMTNKHGVQLRRLPDEVLKKFKGISDEIVQEHAKLDPVAKEVVESFLSFREKAKQWSSISELALMQSR